MRRFLLVAILVCVGGAQAAQARTLNGPTPQPTISRADKASPGFFYGGGGGAGKADKASPGFFYGGGGGAGKGKLDAASKDAARTGIGSFQTQRIRPPAVTIPRLR